MERANKTYGFTIAVKELRETVPNLWRYASAYKRMNNLTSKGLWEMFVEQPDGKSESKAETNNHAIPEEILKTEPGHGVVPDVDPENMEGENYNMCHFWSNFEIARLDFFRSQAYEDFFQMMDRSGGFWMERVSLLSFDMIKFRANIMIFSGVTHLFTLSPLELFCLRRIYTTSATLAIDIQRSSIALQTLHNDR
jgi:hypothetical protein